MAKKFGRARFAIRDKLVFDFIVRLTGSIIPDGLVLLLVNLTLLARVRILKIDSMVVGRFFLVLFLICLPVFAQQEMSEYVQVELVDLYLTATDNKGHFITDLKPGELSVTEDGIPQKIERFGSFIGERGEIPLLLAMVIDNSGSMDSQLGETTRIDLSKEAAESLMSQLGPLDRMMLVRFSDQPVITGLTQNREELSGLVKNLRLVWTQTAMIDSLKTVIEELNKNFGRKVLLLCSDGQDNISRARFRDVIDLAANTTDLTVVVLGVGATNAVVALRGGNDNIPDIPYLRSKEYLQSLADKTAGYAYFPENKKDVDKVLDLIGSFVRSQYYLAYHSSNHDDSHKWRRIDITCKRRGVTLHYRKGYTAG